MTSTSTTTFSGILLLLIVAASLIGAFMPLIIAWMYGVPAKGKIAVLSLALGWTGFGWLAALVIVVAGAIRQQPVRLGVDVITAPAPAGRQSAMS